MPYFVYILRSQKHGRFYTGSTQDVATRLLSHNSGYVPSTKTGVPWEVAYVEQFETLRDATKRERQIKARKSSRYILSLIGPHPVRRHS